MDTRIAAIERCAYCRDWVPITVVEVGSGDGGISAEVSVCEDCRVDGL